jgi:hypothetical protein
MRQIIHVFDGGGCMTLRQPKGQGIDLREFGDVHIERVSSIEFQHMAQKFFIKFAKNGAVLTYHELFESGLIHRDGELYGMTLDGSLSHTREHRTHGVDIALFSEYEDAVKAEVAYIQWLRTTHGVDAV